MCGLFCADTMATVSDPPTRTVYSGGCAYWYDIHYLLSKAVIGMTYITYFLKLLLV